MMHPAAPQKSAKKKPLDVSGVKGSLRAMMAFLGRLSAGMGRLSGQMLLR
jgi:hypothetical protein